MGCTASKLDNEDTVRRCKERRRLMKDAVHSRHHLAAAHSDYLHSLLSTGHALTRFAAGEPISVSHQAPHILLPTPHPIPPSPSAAASSLPSPTPTPFSTPHPPPPPPPYSSSSPSSTISSSKASSIPPQKPSAASAAAAKYPKFPPLNSTYATTPSQASSAWDWENFYPPSPPDSEFFNRLAEERDRVKEQQEHQEDDDESEDSSIEEENGGSHDSRHRHHLPPEQRERDWGNGDHYSSSISSSSKSDDGDEAGLDRDRRSRSDRFPARSEFGGFSSVGRPAQSEIGSSASAIGRRERSEARSPSARWANHRDGSESSASGGGGAGLKMVIRHKDLTEIVAALEEYFAKAAAAGEPVSEFLETGRAQLDRSFRQLKKTVYHSNSVLSALSSTWTSKPPLAIRYRLDTGALEESGGGKSHVSTLERLLAWEKKLYEEVKAREGVKIEHEKKLSTLQSLEYRGKDDAKMDKTKVSIQKLQSLILVTSQAVTTTSSAITRVRDTELAPQLVDLCFSILTMWRSIKQFHEVQSHIAQQVRGLINRPSAGESTSDLHRVATRDLEAAISSWHSSFNRLIKYQREYVRALYGWLKLTLLPVSSDDHRKDHSSPESIKLTNFCDELKQALERLPDTVASEAIKSFVNVIHVISTKQEEELRVKKRTETYSKELDKKSTALRVIEKKFYQSYSTVGLGLPGGGHNGDGQVFDSRDPLAEKKSEIAACRRKVEDEMNRHAKAVEVTRSITLNSIQTGLPGVFQAMTGFSGLFAEALEGVCRKAGSIK